MASMGDKAGSPEHFARGHAALESYLDHMGVQIMGDFNTNMERFDESLELAEEYDLSWDEVFQLLHNDF